MANGPHLKVSLHEAFTLEWLLLLSIEEYEYIQVY